MGLADEDLFLSLANRLKCLDNKQITEKEKEKLEDHSGGKNIKQITKELLSAYDEDVINEKAQKEIDRMCTDGRPSRQSHFIRKPKSISSFIAGFKSAVNLKIDDYIDDHHLDIAKYNRTNHFF